MVKLHDLQPAFGATRKKKRFGRGTGSGHGKTAGRGTKGQKARAGGNIPARFEGGQNPLVQRLPHKRGFTNIFRKEYTLINLDRLASFEEGTEVTLDLLVKKGIVRSARKPIKVLGNGDLSHSLTVFAHRFSASAKAKIEGAGGKVVEVGNEGNPSTASGITSEE